MKWSDKQLSFIKHSQARINIASGSIRSGKTHANLYRFAKFCLDGPKGDLAVFGKTRETVEANVVSPLMDMLPGAVKWVKGSGRLFIFGRENHVIGANNIEAEHKVRGRTLAGGYMNEVTTYPKQVFDQAIARSLTIPDAKFFADCNPDSPYHWLMVERIAAGMPKHRLKHWKFHLEDNPIITADMMAEAKGMYAPGSLFYRRNIDGEWVMAEGVIYQMYDERVHVVDEVLDQPTKVVVGVDYGTATTTAFIMLGLMPDGTWVAIREYYWDALEKRRQKTDGEYAEDLKAFLRGDAYPDPYGQLYPTSIEVDPSAASFRLEAHRRGVSRVRLAENDVLDGIRVTQTALSSGRLLIHKGCENTRKEMTSYAWDEVAQMERGEDKPLKQYDHAMDALRYATMRAIGKKGLGLVATA
jgi:PBSX family phage terminase large subunit